MAVEVDPSKPYVAFFANILKDRDDLYIPPPNSMFGINAEGEILIFYIPIHFDPKTMSTEEISEVVNEAFKNSGATFSNP